MHRLIYTCTRVVHTIVHTRLAGFSRPPEETRLSAVFRRRGGRKSTGEPNLSSKAITRRFRGLASRPPHTHAVVLLARILSPQLSPTLLNPIRQRDERPRMNAPHFMSRATSPVLRVVRARSRVVSGRRWCAVPSVWLGSSGPRGPTRSQPCPRVPIRQLTIQLNTCFNTQQYQMRRYQIQWIQQRRTASLANNTTCNASLSVSRKEAAPPRD